MKTFRKIMYFVISVLVVVGELTAKTIEDRNHVVLHGIFLILLVYVISKEK
jgi:hypothetical protein